MRSKALSSTEMIDAATGATLVFHRKLGNHDSGAFYHFAYRTVPGATPLKLRVTFADYTEVMWREWCDASGEPAPSDPLVRDAAIDAYAEEAGRFTSAVEVHHVDAPYSGTLKVAEFWSSFTSKEARGMRDTLIRLYFDLTARTEAVDGPAYHPDTLRFEPVNAPRHIFATRTAPEMMEAGTTDLLLGVLRKAARFGRG